MPGPPGTRPSTTNAPTPTTGPVAPDFAGSTAPAGFHRLSHALAHDLPTGMKRAQVIRAAAVAKIVRRSRIGRHGR